MGYTYNDFLTKANNEGLIKQFTENDLQIAQKNPEFGFSMLSVMRDANNATTTEQKLLATEVANQLRSSYGSFTAPASSGGFQYANENAYQKALADAMNVGQFQYDAQKDPTYAAYEKAMLREGERASANAIARASAMTGGVPSSYAVTAAQQAQNYYGAQIADKLVDLEQNAYQRYLSDFDQKRAVLSTIGSDRDDAYNRWLNDQERERVLEQDNQDKDRQAYNNALALFEVLGYATPEIAAILGIPEGTTLEPGNQETETQPTQPKDTTAQKQKNIKKGRGAKINEQAHMGPEPDTVDMDSISALGYGDISSEELDTLVKKGLVEEYWVGNVLKFRLTGKGKRAKKSYVNLE